MKAFDQVLPVVLTEYFLFILDYNISDGRGWHRHRSSDIESSSERFQQLLPPTLPLCERS